MVTNDEADGVPGNNNNPPEDPALEQVLNDMFALMDDLYGPSTRWGGGRSIASVSPVGAGAATRSGDTGGVPLAYVVNFGGGEDFAIVSTHPGMDDIIAITESGWLDAAELDAAIAAQHSGEDAATCEGVDPDDDEPDDPDDWVYGDEDMEPCAFVPAPFSSQGRSMSLEENVRGFPVEMLLGAFIEPDNFLKMQPLDEGLPVHNLGGRCENWGPWRSVGGVPPMVKTKWGQGSPFNDNCYTKNGEQAVAGCVAIALGQIGACHRAPSGWAWGVISNYRTYDSSLGVYNEPEASHAQVATYVAKIGSYVKMDYGVKDSGATLANAKKCLKSDFRYGRVAQHRYSFDKVKERLERSTLVYMRGRHSSGGHAFVIDGYIKRERADVYYPRYKQTQYLLHINWGWEGYCDGYFTEGAFSPSDPVLNDTDIGDDIAISGRKAYIKNFKILTWKSVN